MVPDTNFNAVLQALRAAAEPTRLRLLSACAHGELTVGELCLILGQSQPRVSRHLRLLCDAGLLVRFREEHWVYYRTPTQGRSADMAGQILQWLLQDESDLVLRRDRERSVEIRSRRAGASSPDPQLHANDAMISDEFERLLFKEATEAGPIQDLLDVGTGSGHVLKCLAPQAAHAIGLDSSAAALRLARAAIHGLGLSHCVFQQADMHELPFPEASFDVVVLDSILGETPRPAAVIREGARVLRRSGRLIVVEDYDRLEALSAQARSHALALLRGWQEAAGLECTRLRPIEADDRHLILSVGRPRDPLHAAA